MAHDSRRPWPDGRARPRRRVRAGLSDRHDHHGRAVRGRRPDRYRDPARRRADVADLGQQVIVENVGGAGGTLGAGRVAKAEPDGYTLLLHHIGMATSATLYRKLPYDTLNAFEYVGLVTEVPMTIVGAQGLRAERPQGADRLCQGEQGQGHLCQCRHRRGLASVRHAVHERASTRRSRPFPTRAPARR